MKELYNQLIETIKSVPGIEIIGHNLIDSSKHNGLYIFFHSNEKDPEGLFFITRSIDMRYWEYGHTWRIELTVADSPHENGDRPLTYQIYRPLIEQETLTEIDLEIQSLIDNMNYHYNHDAFMKAYNMDKGKYGLWITNPERALLEWRRDRKLNEIGI
jgi:hypothetical protein